MAKPSLRENPATPSWWNRLSCQLLLPQLLDAFAPPRCIDCCIDGTWYCHNCRNNFPPPFQVCIGCKTEHPNGMTCASCREDIPLTGAIACGQYSHKALRRGIEWLKFKGVRHLASILGGLMIPQLQHIGPLNELSKTALLVPIPLHHQKYRQRGFNQSEDIANEISDLCGIEVTPLLIRTKSTASQAKLSHNLRASNMRDAFSLAVSSQEYETITRKKPIVILVDDVATTGSTLIEAARAFPPLPDRYIWGATIARG